MFKAVSLSTEDARLAQAWRGLVRRIQTTIEVMRVTHVKGGPTGRLLQGDVATIVKGKRAVVAAAAGPAVVPVCGIMLEEAGVGESGLCRHSGLATVRFIAGLDEKTMGEGFPVYLSSTPGQATTAKLANPIFLGWIVDSSGYSGKDKDKTFARVLLRIAPPTTS